MSILCFPHHPSPRFHQGGNLAQKLGKHAQSLGPGGAWLETGLTYLSAFEVVSLCEIGKSMESSCLFVRTPMIVLVLSETVERSRSGSLTPLERE